MDDSTALPDPTRHELAGDDRPSGGVPADQGRFRRFRRSCPFWAGLLVLAGGVVILALPVTGVPRYVTAGFSVGQFDPSSRLQMISWPVGMAGGLALVVIGLLLWRRPDRHAGLGVLAMMAAVVAFLLNHLGGLVVGMLLGVVGGGMAVGWEPTAPGDVDEPGDRPPGGRRRLRGRRRDRKARDTEELVTDIW